jgi:hypothetical protein
MDSSVWSAIASFSGVVVAVAALIIVPIRLRAEMRERRRYELHSALIDAVGRTFSLINHVNGLQDSQRVAQTVRQAFLPFERLAPLSESLRERILVFQWELMSVYWITPKIDRRKDFHYMLRDIQDAASYEQDRKGRRYPGPVHKISEAAAKLRRDDEEFFGPI